MIAIKKLLRATEINGCLDSELSTEGITFSWGIHTNHEIEAYTSFELGKMKSLCIFIAAFQSGKK